MNTKKLILEEIKKVPEPLLDEVLDFIHFLENKTLEQKTETAIASESSLKKEWLNSEENKAWQDL